MKIFKYTIYVFLLLVNISCNEWLNIKPEDEIGEYDLIKDQEGVTRALNGIYGNLMNPSLYGTDLTARALEVLAQQYTISDDINNLHTMALLADYDYDSEAVKMIFNAPWLHAYNTIANINNLLQKMVLIKDQFKEEKEYEGMRGELYGVRAFLHFDMLRLFGPMQYELNKKDNAIPYYTRLVDSPEPILTAEEVILKIEHDMAIAMQLLQNDPVLIGTGSRKYNMNYAAVRALRARVSLYKGDLPMAYQYASALLSIAEGSPSIVDKAFPWTSSERATDNDSPDRMFTSEVMFATTHTNRDQLHDDLFDEKLKSIEILGISNTLYSELFLSTIPDWRKNSWESIENIKVEKGLNKFEEFDSSNPSIIESSTIIPLIRKSEMLLIMIECASTQSEKQRLINFFAQKRGAEGQIENQSDIEKYLQNEYRKEFFGEGQYFYFLKRKGIKTLVRWLDKTAHNTINMDKNKYVPPLPDSEIKYRD